MKQKHRKANRKKANKIDLDKAAMYKKLRVWTIARILKFIFIVIALFNIVFVIQTGGSPGHTIMIILCIVFWFTTNVLSYYKVKQIDRETKEEKQRMELLTRLATALNQEISRWY